MLRYTGSGRFGLGTFALILVAGVGAGTACGEEFSTCEARKTCPPEDAAGSGGSAGRAGDDSTDSAGAAGDLGGRTSGGFGGSLGETPPVAEAGTSASDDDAGGAGGAGGSGAIGGSAGASPTEEACETEGETACSPDSPAAVLRCEGGVWESSACAEGQRCNSAAPACAPVVEGCAEQAPGFAFCSGRTSRVCGPDLVTIEEETCAGACINGHCVSASCGDGIAQTGEQCDDKNTVETDGCRNDCSWGVVAVDVGNEFSCALLGDGSMRCWGANNLGQLGGDSLAVRGTLPSHMGKALPKVQLTGAVTNFAVGQSHACAIIGQQVWCWGGNFSGAVGIDSDELVINVPRRVDFGEGVPTDLALGPDLTCLLLQSGAVKCWGENGSGQLGVGDPTNDVGDGGAEMGSNLSEVAFSDNLPGDRALSIAAGAYHGCAVMESGAVSCWGEASALMGRSVGALEVAPPGYVTARTGNATSITAGARHNCVLTASGGVRCWGYNTAGVLGYGDELTRGADALLVDVPLPGPASMVVASYRNACAVVDRQAYCWGADILALGQPAFFGVNSIGDAPNEISGRLPPIDLGERQVVSLAIANTHACALITNGRVVCWGDNSRGQLGRGDTSDIGDQVTDMGAAIKEVQLY